MKNNLKIFTEQLLQIFFKKSVWQKWGILYDVDFEK